MAWYDVKEKSRLAEEAELAFHYSKTLNSKGLPIATIKEEIDKLHRETRRIKKEGVSVWNAKAVLPKIFDVVDGAFVAMKSLVEKIEELEIKVDKKVDK